MGIINESTVLGIPVRGLFVEEAATAWLFEAS